MSEERHTKGLLQITHRDPMQICDGGEFGRGCAPVARAKTPHGGGGEWRAEARANIRRLVACWNACDGISTQNLEDNLSVKELADRYNAALAQRDELLASLKAALPVLRRAAYLMLDEKYAGTPSQADPFHQEVKRRYKNVRDAIAKAEASNERP